MSAPDSLAPIERKPPERSGPWANPIGIEGETSNPYFYLRAYWHILLKRRWTVLTVTLVLTTLVAIVSFKMQPVYEARAQVEVEAATPQIQSLNDLDRASSIDQAFLETQAEVIESDSLAWRTIQQLKLGENPAFIPSLKRSEPQGGDAASATQGRLIKEFRDHLRVVRTMNSRLIKVRFESTDSRLAAQVANALVNNYIEYNFRSKYDATRQASDWMEQQLDELKAKVEKSQQAMVDYERQNTIVNISDKENVVEQRLADLSRDLTNAQSDRLQKESLYNLVRANESQVVFIAQNELLQNLEEKYAELRGRYVEALGQFGPKFPTVIRLREMVSESEVLIDKERKRFVARILQDYQAALGRERLLTAVVAGVKTEVGKLNQLLIQHNMLKREFETNQQLYENLLHRVKDATVSAGLRATNIHLVDPAMTPTAPVRPKVLLNIAVGLLVGLILGLAFAFVEEGLDNSVKSPDDVEQLIDAPALAIIPLAPSNNGRRSWLKGHRDKGRSPDGTVELTMVKQPISLLAESYRSLCTAVLLSSAPHPPQAVLVTSPQSGEGKTCTTLNLALTLAQRGARALLVDADLRQPGVVRALGLPEGKGLSSVLTGAHSLGDVLYQVEALSGLWVLPAGPRLPNPAELLSSRSMEELLRRLRQQFDHLVLDSPPLLMVTDATILSTLVDGVILVAEAGVTTRGALVRAQKLLRSAGGGALGVALNKFSLRDGSPYYYESYYTSYYSSYYREEAAGSKLESETAIAEQSSIPRDIKLLPDIQDSQPANFRRRSQKAFDAFSGNCL